MAFTKLIVVFVIVAFAALEVKGSPFGALVQQPAKLLGTILSGDNSPVKQASEFSERNPLQGILPTDALSKLCESASTLGLGTDPSKLTELASGVPGHNLLSQSISALGSNPELLPRAGKSPFKLF